MGVQFFREITLKNKMANFFPFLQKYLVLPLITTNWEKGTRKSLLPTSFSNKIVRAKVVKFIGTTFSQLKTIS